MGGGGELWGRTTGKTDTRPGIGGSRSRWVASTISFPGVPAGGGTSQPPCLLRSFSLIGLIRSCRILQGLVSTPAVRSCGLPCSRGPLVSVLYLCYLFDLALNFLSFFLFFLTYPLNILDNIIVLVLLPCYQLPPHCRVEAQSWLVTLPGP